MEIPKNLKRGEKVTYDDILEDEENIFSDKAKRYGWAKYEVSRLMDFVAIAYSELKYGNMLTERFKNEMSLDIPVWDSGVVDKFLDEDEKKLIYEHLAIIKKYLKENETSE